MAIAVGLRDDSNSAAAIDLFVNGQLFSTTISGTTGTTDQFGVFSVGVVYAFNTAWGAYFSSATSVLSAWHANQGYSKNRQAGLADWTEDPWSIYYQPKRKYYWAHASTEVNASLTGSLSLGATISGALSGKKASLTLKNAAGIAQANLTSLKWAWWDYVTPDLIAAAPTDKGTALTTDANGLCEIPLVNSTKNSGEIGWVVITNSDGTTTQNPVHNAFTGPIAVD
jgi:hypothetical protein